MYVLLFLLLVRNLFFPDISPVCTVGQQELRRHISEGWREMRHTVHIQTKRGVRCFQFSTWPHNDTAIHASIFYRRVAYIEHVAVNAVSVTSAQTTHIDASFCHYYPSFS